MCMIGPTCAYIYWIRKVNQLWSWKSWRCLQWWKNSLLEVWLDFLIQAQIYHHPRYRLHYYYSFLALFTFFPPIWSWNCNEWIYVTCWSQRDTTKLHIIYIHDKKGQRQLMIHVHVNFVAKVFAETKKKNWLWNARIIIVVVGGFVWEHHQQRYRHGPTNPQNSDIFNSKCFRTAGALLLTLSLKYETVNKPTAMTMDGRKKDLMMH